jgi:hypothetical protein
MSQEFEDAVHKDMNRLRGRLAGALEAMGLDEKQERSAIALMKSITYDVEENLIDLIDD